MILKHTVTPSMLKVQITNIFHCGAARRRQKIGFLSCSAVFPRYFLSISDNLQSLFVAIEHFGFFQGRPEAAECSPESLGTKVCKYSLKYLRSSGLDLKYLRIGDPHPPTPSYQSDLYITGIPSTIPYKRLRNQGL